uniref:Uncharacterized protein n=1 Tax=Caenorhabditis japonica TaxID=281687 RepID=A0A8R1EL29_CAEJA
MFFFQSFAREFVPDIRLSRPEKPEKLQVGQTCHVLFSVTNLSLSTLTITITPQNGDGMIQCTTAPIDLVLPSRKEADAASVQGVPAEQ